MLRPLRMEQVPDADVDKYLVVKEIESGGEKSNWALLDSGMSPENQVAILPRKLTVAPPFAVEVTIIPHGGTGGKGQETGRLNFDWGPRVNSKRLFFDRERIITSNFGSARLRCEYVVCGTKSGRTIIQERRMRNGTVVGLYQYEVERNKGSRCFGIAVRGSCAIDNVIVRKLVRQDNLFFEERKGL